MFALTFKCSYDEADVSYHSYKLKLGHDIDDQKWFNDIVITTNVNN